MYAPVTPIDNIMDLGALCIVGVIILIIAAATIKAMLDPNNKSD